MEAYDLRPLARLLVISFAAAALAMHFVQPGLSAVEDAVSFYMNGRLGRAFGGTLVCLGIGSLLLAHETQRWTGLRWRHPGLLLLVAWSVGCIIGGIFPPDPPGQWNRPPSFSGIAHNAAAMIAFLSFPAAAGVLARALPRAHHLQALATVSVVATAVFFACLSPAILTDGPPVALGLSERVALAANVCWLVAALRVPAERHDQPGPNSHRAI
jgi:hypothetical protein